MDYAHYHSITRGVASQRPHLSSLLVQHLGQPGVVLVRERTMVEPFAILQMRQPGLFDRWEGLYRPLAERDSGVMARLLHTP